MAAALALAALSPAFAQGPPTTGQDGATVRQSAADVKRAYFALQDEYDTAFEAYREALMALRSNPGGERPAAPQAGFYARFVALADAGSAESQLWVLQNHTVSGLEGDAAATDKRSRYLSFLASQPSNEQLGLLSRVLMADATGRGALTKEEGLAFLDLIVATATDAEVQAGAAYMKASAQDVRGGARDVRLPAIEALKAVAARWPDTTAGKRAGGAAFAFENLNVGQTAPEIVGADVDGNPMKLSDFEGKVRVLDFWGFW